METTTYPEDEQLIVNCREINLNLRIVSRIEKTVTAPLSEVEREYLILYIEMYRNLSLYIADNKMMREWLFTYNSTLQNYPVHMILSTDSLKEVKEYLASILSY